MKNLMTALERMVYGKTAQEVADMRLALMQERVEARLQREYAGLDEMYDDVRCPNGHDDWKPVYEATGTPHSIPDGYRCRTCGEHFYWPVEANAGKQP